MKSASSALFLGLALLLGACGAPDRPEPAACSAANCAGCCLEGICRAGTEAEVCGAGGAACQTCDAGELCSAGECRPVGDGCSAANCDGCCDEGVCRPGITTAACGAGGAACDTCDAEDVCDNGACGPPAVTCGPDTCAGCCRAGVCETGDAVTACGFGGQACNTCTGGDVCGSGQCRPPTITCGASSCAGCCRDGVCHGGITAAGCGSGGGACQTCPDGQSCDGGQCRVVEAGCGPDNCAGCCRLGKCEEGTDVTACGYGGAACNTCTGGDVCGSGQCRPPTTNCGPSSCGGCCRLGVCLPGTTADACGGGGGGCATCSGGDACEGGQCRPPGTTCGPGNCAGCCRDGICYAGVTAGACGVDGEACGSCSGGQACESGECRETTLPCGPSTCTGCCRLGVCVEGNTRAACGYGGNACNACTDDDVCTSGQCRPPATSCGPGNCAGCCRDGVCRTGVTAGACGVGGGTCATCETGEACSDGWCAASVDPCGPATCAGCCREGRCELGITADTCGAGGAACGTCSGTDRCADGQCRPAPVTCDATTCDGCCNDGVCEAGFASDMCGRRGEACGVCPAEYGCDAGVCAPLARIGDPCAAGEDCAGGACFVGLPGGGYCTAYCSPEPCPPEATCVLVGENALCLRSCAVDGDCREDYLCLDELCLPKCTSNSDCNSGLCDRQSGECLPQGNVGGECTTDAECGTGYVCAASAPGGYCTKPCDHLSGCPSGSDCVTVGGGNVCLADCGSDWDCREGYVCAEGNCAPRCSASLPCPGGYTCDEGSGYCTLSGPAPGEIGAACETGSDCASQECLTEESSGWPQGYCSDGCGSIDGTDYHCTDGAICLPTEYEGDDYVGFCLDLCTQGSDCRSAYVCWKFDEVWGICLPSCAAWDYCDAETEVCDPHSGSCVEKTSSGPVVTVERTTLSSIQVPQMQFSSTVTVDVPADALSLTVALNGDPTGELYLGSVRGPNGNLFDINDPIGGRMRPYWSDTGGSQVTYIPNSPSLDLPPGPYEFTWFTDGAPFSAQPTSWIKRSTSPLISEGVVDINLIFVGHPTLNATSAQSSTSFTNLLLQTRAILASAGIEAGEVHFADLTGEAAAQFTNLRYDDFGLLTRESAAFPPDRLNVFWVRSITGSGLEGGTILGVSAGIPGSALAGSGSAGVVIALGDFPHAGWRAEDLAGTLAHEVGHWMGLFHTSESDGRSHDVLADTAECPASRDANGDGIVSATECLGHGGKNMMFWAKDGSVEQTTITPNQKFVMLRHPAVR